MAKKIAKEVNSKTIIKCKEYEIIEGDINSPLWVIEIDGKLKVAIDANEYLEMMELTNKLLKENEYIITMEDGALNGVGFSSAGLKPFPF